MPDRCIWIMDGNYDRYHVLKMIIDFDFDVKSQNSPECELIQIIALPFPPCSDLS